MPVLEEKKELLDPRDPLDSTDFLGHQERPDVWVLLEMMEPLEAAVKGVKLDQPEVQAFQDLLD